MSYFEQIDKSRIPNHVAIIMDGNGRWAKERGLARIYGHQQGVDVLHDIITTVAETGVKYLTMYAFSLENWNRPKDEVSSLMDIAVELIRKERSTLIEKNVRLLTLGDNDLLPDKVKDAFMECEEVTKNNTGLTLIFALSYSSRWEITEMAKRIARQAVEGKVKVEDISEDYVSSQLSTGLLGIPDPDLLIRTSGEQRISNYLLWQIAYSELYFTQCRWPDFNDEEFYKAIVDYQHRERRFGKTSEQIK
ncbi:MAG: isoprenyl transferase [Paludibacteraceae bacterium]|nr:isoprenyl transferase [Paludibacteraceae bacterium]MBR3647227.1 isoprenyl transferase [Paludibacteraceae bacterium]